MAICNAVPSQPNPSQIYQTPTAFFIQAARDMDPTPSYPVPHASMLETMQAVNSTSLTLTRARTPTLSVTSLSSPMEGQPSTGELKSLMRSQGNSPVAQTNLSSSYQPITNPSGALRADEAQCTLFPTSSEMGFLLSQLPAKELFLVGNTPSSDTEIDVLSPCAGDQLVAAPHTQGMPNDKFVDNILVLFPTGQLSMPPGSGQTGLMDVDSSHMQLNLLTEGQKVEEKEISHFMPSSQNHSLPGSWDSA